MFTLKPSAALAAVCLSLASAAAGAGVAPAPAVSPSGPQVKIDNFTFGPAALTVPVGATVIWTNRDDIPHTVTAVDKTFKSKVLDTDQSFSFTFTRAGEYPYFCSLHPHMTGKVVVR